MKYLTKEWQNNLDFQELNYMLNPSTNIIMPILLLGNGEEFISSGDMYTLKTEFDLPEGDNVAKFLFIPKTFEFCSEYEKLADYPARRTVKLEFLSQYINRLRIISNLPKQVLSLVRDKRLLAMGYAEPQAKQAILEYTERIVNRAFRLWDEVYENSVYEEEGLTAYNQFLLHGYIKSTQELFENARIIKVETAGDRKLFTLKNGERFILSGVEVLEEETCVNGAEIEAYELYNNKTNHELHFLLRKTDVNLVDHLYYATYRFEDMILK